MNIATLTATLRQTLGVRHKLDIQPVRELLRAAPNSPMPIGDDCAAIPDGEGYLLFAIEGLLPSFVAAEPWFAGYCAVMVNVSDIAAMGGRAIAFVDAIWTDGSLRAAPIWEGMTAAAAKYGVPIVGGHTNARNPSGDYLAAAIVGRASKLLTSFDARPEDVLIAAIDLRGEWFGHYPYWNASTAADGARLRADLAVLPSLAEDALCSSAKDISMGGIVGTAVMLAECSGVGFTLDIERIPRPASSPLEKWLTAFPSFGFLLAVDHAHAAEVCRRFSDRGISAAVVGSCNASRHCMLRSADGDESTFWNLNTDPFINFGCAAPLRGFE